MLTQSPVTTVARCRTGKVYRRRRVAVILLIVGHCSVDRQVLRRNVGCQPSGLAHCVVAGVPS